ncbi:MAG: nitroreductase family protein [Desulfovibrionaceae bacterium]|nr:nitroreductase family protein [Desulfovibrionaceae bacterium]
MKKVFCLLLGLLLLSVPVTSQAGEKNIALPPVSELSGTDLFQAVKERSSLRAFSEKELSLQDLGDALWTAAGVKTPGGKWVIPFARRTSPTFKVYVTGEKGTYLYNGAEHLLEFVSVQDLRGEAVLQDFAAEAPALLLYVASPEPLLGKDSRPLEEVLHSVYLSCGAAMQNVYLTAAARELATCYIGSIKHGEWEKELKMTPQEFYYGAMPLGYPAE